MLDAVTFSISCLLLLFLPNKNQVFQSEERTAINDLKEGFKYFLSIYELRIVTVSISLSLVGAGALFVLGNSYLTESLKFTQSSFGFMIASFGFGIISIMVILSYFVTSFKRIPFFIGISMIITGTSLLFAFNSQENFLHFYFLFLFQELAQGQFIY